MALDKATIIDYAQRFRAALTPRNGFRAAAYGAAFLGAVSVGSTAISVMTASLSPANAQTMLVTPPMAPMLPQPSAPTAAIPKEQCNFLFDTATDSMKKHGKDFISDVTRVSLRRFFESVPGSKVIDCAGPREIAWERESDYVFVIALADVTGGKFNGKEVDFRMGYGFRPAAKAVNPTVSERAPWRSARRLIKQHLVQGLLPSGPLP